MLIDGLFIGNSLSSILTEVFLGDMESKMEGKSWFPRKWLQYVDDVFAVVKNGDTERILEKLNGMNDKIKFTYVLNTDDEGL